MQMPTRRRASQRRRGGRRPHPVFTGLGVERRPSAPRGGGPQRRVLPAERRRQPRVEPGMRHPARKPGVRRTRFGGGSWSRVDLSNQPDQAAWGSQPRTGWAADREPPEHGIRPGEATASHGLGRSQASQAWAVDARWLAKPGPPRWKHACTGGAPPPGGHQPPGGSQPALEAEHHRERHTDLEQVSRTVEACTAEAEPASLSITPWAITTLEAGPPSWGATEPQAWSSPPGRRPITTVWEADATKAWRATTGSRWEGEQRHRGGSHQPGGARSPSLGGARRSHWEQPTWERAEFSQGLGEAAGATSLGSDRPRCGAPPPWGGRRTTQGHGRAPPATCSSASRRAPPRVGAPPSWQSTASFTGGSWGLDG
ncbi:unnamed protein product [Gadus morhua 'NCC']